MYRVSQAPSTPALTATDPDFDDNFDDSDIASRAPLGRSFFADTFFSIRSCIFFLVVVGCTTLALTSTVWGLVYGLSASSLAVETQQQFAGRVYEDIRTQLTAIQKATNATLMASKSGLNMNGNFAQGSYYIKSSFANALCDVRNISNIKFVGYSTIQNSSNLMQIVNWPGISTRPNTVNSLIASNSTSLGVIQVSQDNLSPTLSSYDYRQLWGN
ncbi:abcB7, partial [Acrasis kona]